MELLRAKLEQANNKNDVLRENYEMIDTKLSQVFSYRLCCRRLHLDYDQRCHRLRKRSLQTHD